MVVRLDGRSLTVEDVVKVSRGSADGFARVELDPAASERARGVRQFMNENWMSEGGPPIYGFNTGHGPFKDRRVAISDIPEHQRRSILAHATGVGEPFSEEVTRAMMLFRANVIMMGVTGARVEVAQRLVDFLNAGLHPVIPQKGSVGTSGDLPPGAHMAGAFYGFDEAEIVYKGRRMPAVEAIAAAGFTPRIELYSKDSSALIGGAAASLALAALALHDTKRLLKTADISLSLSLEAMRGELAAFDPRLHRVRPHPGQARVARNVLRVVEKTERCTPAARNVVFPDEARAPGSVAPPRVQDVYSLRCAPQVHGPAADALTYIESVVVTELNSAQENPIVARDEEATYVPLCGGQFHAQYLAQVTDILSIALADLGSISERRLARLIDPNMSHGLPRNLVKGQAGLNTGYSTVQCSLSALVMENRHLATPGSVDSIPGKGNVEDHVSNSTWCSRKAAIVVENVQQIVGGELLLAAQALSLVEPIASQFPIGVGSRAAFEAIRVAIPPALDGDRWYAAEMAEALALVKSGAVLDAVENRVGPLE